MTHMTYKRHNLYKNIQQNNLNKNIVARRCVVVIFLQAQGPKKGAFKGALSIGK